MSDLPEILVVEDVAEILRISVGAARRRIGLGECGPYCKIGRRIVIRREAFLQAVRNRESVEGSAGPCEPKPDPQLREMLGLEGGPPGGSRGK